VFVEVMKSINFEFVNAQMYPKNILILKHRNFPRMVQLENPILLYNLIFVSQYSQIILKNFEDFHADFQVRKNSMSSSPIWLKFGFDIKSDDEHFGTL
jgi:hypothetical protein